jgi:tRNA(Ile)-lysidine synthase
MSDLSSRLLTHIRDADLFPRPGLALLAVSGGEDSVALLDLFSTIAADLGLVLSLAHVDHGIAPESADVAEQVMALAAQYHVPGHLRSLNLGPAAAETRARTDRYRSLREVQAEITADYLVTAHHADDQIETALFRFLRGSAPAGLAGMSARGPRGLTRPLLPFRRAELKDWLSQNLAPDTWPLVHHDPANRDIRHDRSWLRQQLLPLLRERFGNRLDANLLVGQRHAEHDRAAWSSLIREWPELDFRATDSGVDVARGPLRTYDKVLSEALLRALAREAGCVLGPTRAAKLVDLAQSGTSGRMLELGDRWIAELVFDRLRIRRRSEPESPPSSEWGATDSGAVEWGEWQISWRREPAGVATREGLTTWVAREPGEIRAVHSGDRVFPLGGVGRRSVHRLLMEARVPRSERTAYPVVVQGSDLVWVPGVCRAANAVPFPGEISLRIDARRS